jgi:multidrug efflux pump subunit AcrA (membrane-fusion protein)
LRNRRLFFPDGKQRGKSPLFLYSLASTNLETILKMHRKSLGNAAFFLLLFFLPPLFSCQREPGDIDREEAVRVEAVRVRKGDIAQELRFTGSIEPIAEVRVFPKITAAIEALFVDQGDAVEKDDPLALLESEELKARVAQAEAVLQNRQAQWAQMEVGARAEEISQAKDLVAKAKVKLKDAEIERERMQSLFFRGFIARRDLESADLAHSIAQPDLNTAEKKLALRPPRWFSSGAASP